MFNIFNIINILSHIYQVDNMHPLFRLKDNENLISYKTARYDSSPLICKVLNFTCFASTKVQILTQKALQQGAAAGAELTASAVLGDMLRLARGFK